jgi:hypothetical protein
MLHAKQPEICAYVCAGAESASEREREKRVLMQRKEDPLATCVGDVNFLLQLAGGITKSPF